MRRVEDLHTALLSKKSSERKAALKNLSSWLEVRDFLLKLDEMTHSLPQLADLTPCQESWPALCHSLCKCIHLELAASPTGKSSSPKFARRKISRPKSRATVSSLSAQRWRSFVADPSSRS